MADRIAGSVGVTDIRKVRVEPRQSAFIDNHVSVETVDTIIIHDRQMMGGSAGVVQFNNQVVLQLALYTECPRIDLPHLELAAKPIHVGTHPIDSAGGIHSDVARVDDGTGLVES